VFAATLCAAVLSGLCAAAPLAAQEPISEAVLLRGPTPVYGIPVYAPNRIPAYRGVYTIDGELLSGTGGGAGDTEERVRLSVLFTRQDLLVPATWSIRRCGAWRLYQVPDYETFTLCFPLERGFFLFFFFPEIREPAYWCGFTDPFIERFLFLLNFVDGDAEVPFPAILQIRQ
jgi:hypothetical protein